MDLYWVVRGACSPVAYFKRYPGRFKMYHVKDDKEIGQSGMVGYDAIFRNADVAGVQAIVAEIEQYTMPVEQSVEESLRYLQDLFSEEIKVVTSGNIWVDFIAPGANKGTGLARLLDHLGLSPEDGIAFGDQYNDVEMLQLAGTSYAMSGAAPGIAYYSTYVTDSVVEVLQDIAAGV